MELRGTTIVCVRKNGKCAIAGDGQVTMGEYVGCIMIRFPWGLPEVLPTPLPFAICLNPSCRNIREIFTGPVWSLHRCGAVTEL